MKANENAEEKILLAAIEEFGEQGYQNASTNNIMKRAGVSKGLIFHYFGNKERLYLACTKHVLELYSDEVTAKIDHSQTDILERIYDASLIKLEFLRNHQYTGRFIIRMKESAAKNEIPTATAYLNDLVVKLMQNFLSGLDNSRYRKDIPEDGIINYILLIVDAYETKYQKMNINETSKLLDFMEGFTQSFDTLRKLIARGIYE